MQSSALEKSISKAQTTLFYLGFFLSVGVSRSFGSDCILTKGIQHSVKSGNSTDSSKIARITLDEI